MENINNQPMTQQANDTPANGYYTVIDGRLYGPINEPYPELPLGKRLLEAVMEGWKNHFKSLPSYAVSPDLELKERMVLDVDFQFDYNHPMGMVRGQEQYANTMQQSYGTCAIPIKKSTLLKASVEDEQGNFYDPLFDLLHQEHGLTLLQSEMNDIIQVVKKMETAAGGECKIDENTDLQEQIRRHIKHDELFDWHEALTENEMGYLEQLLLTYSPKLKPGTVGNPSRSFTSKDMVDFAEWICGDFPSDGWTYSPDHKNWSKWIGNGLDGKINHHTTSELIEKFFNDVKK